MKKLLIIVLFIYSKSFGQIVNITGTAPQLRYLPSATAIDSVAALAPGDRTLRLINKFDIYGNNTNGVFNYGLGSLLNADATEIGLIEIGRDALRTQAGKNYITAIGYQPGYNYNGNGESVFIGAYRPGYSQTAGVNNLLLSATAQADLPNLSGSNQMNLGNVIWATGANGSSGSNVSPGALVGIGINAPTSTLHLNGSMAYAITSKTATYTATDQDRTILCDNTITINLPDAATCVGREYVVKNIGAGTVTVDPNGSQTIDGATTYPISVQYAGIKFQSDGTNWFITSSF